MRDQADQLRQHHLSTFWSGIYIGIGTPIFILALVEGEQIPFESR